MIPELKRTQKYYYYFDRKEKTKMRNVMSVVRFEECFCESWCEFTSRAVSVQSDDDVA